LGFCKSCNAYWFITLTKQNFVTKLGAISLIKLGAITLPLRDFATKLGAITLPLREGKIFCKKILGGGIYILLN
jgi:hypothetical protein